MKEHWRQDKEKYQGDFQAAINSNDNAEYQVQTLAKLIEGHEKAQRLRWVARGK
jgi:hypothetical protein